MWKGGFESRLQTFQRREEVVAIAPPTGESNPVASGRSGGEIPIEGVSDQAARFSRRAPSANRDRIGGMGAGVVQGTHRLRSGVDVGVEAVHLTCSEVKSTTSSTPWACAQRLEDEVKVWKAKECQGPAPDLADPGGSTQYRAQMARSNREKSGGIP